MILSTKPNEMFFESKLIRGIFVDRPNRFLTLVQINNEVVESHLPDPGRLKELLILGVTVLVRPEPNKNRKTGFTTVAVFKDDILVSLNTQLPNLWVKHLINLRQIEALSGWTLRKQEYTIGHSRFDFLLSKNSNEMILEVKSVTLVENNVALFPDAVTERGCRHVRHLSELSKSSINTAILFVIQREDAEVIQPNWLRDPKFAQALLDADEQGVKIYGIKGKLCSDKIVYQGQVPVTLKPDINRI